MTALRQYDHATEDRPFMAEMNQSVDRQFCSIHAARLVTSAGARGQKAGGLHEIGIAWLQRLQPDRAEHARSETDANLSANSRGPGRNTLSLLAAKRRLIARHLERI